MENIKWTQTSLEEYIKNEVEESLYLDYKAADALKKNDTAKKDITKDVSAMANADGGLIIYGIREFTNKKYFPEKIDPIDRNDFSKEWLEHVISNIQARISGLIIHPVKLTTSPNHVAYVVEVPRSTTAHQCTDKKYYMRYNFEACPMEDYQIKETINRVNYSDVNITFGLSIGAIGDQENAISDIHYRKIHAIIRNMGNHIVNHYKVELKLNNVTREDDNGSSNINLVKLHRVKDPTRQKLLNTEIGLSGSLYIAYHSDAILFPQEEIDIGTIIGFGYPDNETWQEGTQWKDWAQGHTWVIKWKLYADNMPYKEGEESVWNLPILKLSQIVK